jgi:hypothetical protein
MPLFAIRELVKEDAPFAIRHPLLIPAYVWRYSWTAPKRLLAYLGKEHYGGIIRLRSRAFAAGSWNFERPARTGACDGPQRM